MLNGKIQLDGASGWRRDGFRVDVSRGLRAGGFRAACGAPAERPACKPEHAMKADQAELKIQPRDVSGAIRPSRRARSTAFAAQRMWRRPVKLVSSGRGLAWRCLLDQTNPFGLTLQDLAKADSDQRRPSAPRYFGQADNIAADPRQHVTRRSGVCGAARHLPIRLAVAMIDDLRFAGIT
jgi:hypothetical protein